MYFLKKLSIIIHPDRDSPYNPLLSKLKQFKVTKKSQSPCLSKPKILCKLSFYSAEGNPTEERRGKKDEEETESVGEKLTSTELEGKEQVGCNGYLNPFVSAPKQLTTYQCFASCSIGRAA